MKRRQARRQQSLSSQLGSDVFFVLVFVPDARMMYRLRQSGCVR